MEEYACVLKHRGWNSRRTSLGAAMGRATELFCKTHTSSARPSSPHHVRCKPLLQLIVRTTYHSEANLSGLKLWHGKPLWSRIRVVTGSGVIAEQAVLVLLRTLVISSGARRVAI